MRLSIWLPTMDLNHDKQIQSLLCYRYTSRQCSGESTSSGPGVNHRRTLTFPAARPGEGQAGVFGRARV